MNDQSPNPSSVPSHSRRKATRAIVVVGLVAWCVLVGMGVVLIKAVSEAREAARGSQCRGNLSQLSMALLNYHDTYKSLPPAYIADADGKPMHSWRVLILPFLNERDVYEQYDFDEPWNGPNNQKLADKINLYSFQCPTGPNLNASLMTDYVVVVGSTTAFPESQSIAFDAAEDGRENTILIAETANSNIHWMEPRDLRFDEMSFVVNDPQRPSISSPHSSGPAVVFADSITAYRLDNSLRPTSLRSLTTVAGYEPVSRDQFFRPTEKCHRRLAE